MLSLTAALVLVSAPSPDGYAVFRYAQRGAVPLRAIHVPTGARALFHGDDGLVHARVVTRGRFSEWLRSEGLSAVVESEQQLLPVVLSRAPAPVLAAFGRVEETKNPGVHRVYLGPGVVDPEAVAKSLRELPGVVWAEPDQWGAFETRASFDDNLYLNQWYLHPSKMTNVAPGVDIRADSAWDKSLGTGVRIAVLDDGFSLAHPDLVDAYLREGETVVGKDFADGDDDPSTVSSADGHGTRVLGVLAARAGNAIGIVGVCPECVAIPVRVFSSGNFNAASLYGEMSVAAEAMIWAADLGARIINNSWGPIVSTTSPTYQAMPQIVADAIGGLVTRGTPAGKSGVLVVFAVGNGGQSFVASFDGWVSDPRVLSVGAVNAAGVLANYSQIGPAVRLLAPSSENSSQTLPAVYTTDKSDTYSSTFGGTSAAAPIVSGVAALVLARHPELSLAQLMEVLIDSARKVKPEQARYGRSGRSCKYGFGAVDARGALDLADARAAAYADGYTFTFELCNDGIDNDGNAATNDSCVPVCVPTKRADEPNGLDDDCDGYIDNPQACVPSGKDRCEICEQDVDCAQDFVCMQRTDGKRCLRTCGPDLPCAFSEICAAGACLPTRSGTLFECGAFLQCAPTNAGVERCDDVDNDCNGVVDDLTTQNQDQLTATLDCRRAKLGVCAVVIASCVGGLWSCNEPPGYAEDEVEMCDSLDNDCDGELDEGCPQKPPPTPVAPATCQNAAPALWYVGIVVLALRRHHDRQRRRRH